MVRTVSKFWENVPSRWRALFRVASSRCLPSPARCFHGREFLLLDEPSLGLAPQIVAKIFEIIRELKARGMTILLVEQNAAAAIGVSDRVYILNNGAISRHGTAEEFGDGSDLMDELTGVHS